MSAVDLQVNEGVPHTGLYTSDQGAILLTDDNLELARIERGWIRVNNGVDVYREAGYRHGTTYAGTPRVVGQITRAFVNMAELKMILGREPTDATPVGPGVLTGTELLEFINQPSLSYPIHAVGKNWYPIKVDIAMMVNADELPVIGTSNPDSPNISTGKSQTIIAKNCIINNYALVFDSRGLITSGPMDFLGSAAQWRIDSE